MVLETTFDQDRGHVRRKVVAPPPPATRVRKERKTHRSGRGKRRLLLLFCLQLPRPAVTQVLLSRIK